jgi:predicted aminopeptidase
LWHRQGIDEVLLDPSVEEQTRTRLELVKEILMFAEKDLGLPVGDTYSTYVSTGKPYIVWNVFAAPQRSLEMKTFCYPITGCVSYQGYFEEAKAQARADKLAGDGYDVFVGGVTAYSTLGWFSDPVLDTFLMRSELGLVSLLFHELAHKVIYISGDTSFNESFATALAKEGLKRWLLVREEEHLFQAAQQSSRRKSEVIRLISDSREKLTKLYASESSTLEMNQKKIEILNQLPLDYELLRQNWGMGNEFQSWMLKTGKYSKLNNAKLGTIADYNHWVPAFLQLLSENDGEIELFIQSVKKLGQQNRLARHQSLGQLHYASGGENGPRTM